MTRLALAMACALVAPAFAADLPKLDPQDSGVTVRLRGISAVDANIAWASGREGTVLRTVDGGRHWTNVSVPDAKDLDFRDVEGFDADNAVVLSIGPGAASRVYVTIDGGKHWDLALKNDDERAFFDCMVFDGQSGWMLGDPVDGMFQIRTTNDGGRHWALMPTGPKALQDEAAFAASGTCIALTRWNDPVVVGGGAAAHAHVARHTGLEWITHDTKMTHRVPAAGIFSAAVVDSIALLVGGDFEQESQGSAALLRFGAHGGWVDPLPAPRGYRSGVACLNSATCIAVGPSGVDLIKTPWRRNPAWTAISDIGYDAIDLVDGVAWTSGDKGRIARITWSSTPAQAPRSPSTPKPPSQQSQP